MKLRQIALAALISLPALLVSCGGQLPGESVAAAAERAREAGSARVAMTVATKLPSGALTMSGDGAFDFEANRGKLTLSTSGSGVPAAMTGAMGTTETVYDGSVVYMRMPIFEQVLPAGKSWVKMDLQVLGEKMGVDFQQLSQIGQNNPSQGIDYLNGATNVEEVGSEDIRGTSTTHYSGTLDFERLAEDLPPEAASSVRKVMELSGVRKAPLDVWLDDEGLPRRVKYSFANPGSTSQGLGEMTLTTDFFDYGSVVAIRVPPAASVVDIQDLVSAKGSQ